MNSFRKDEGDVGQTAKNIVAKWKTLTADAINCEKTSGKGDKKIKVKVEKTDRIASVPNSSPAVKTTRNENPVAPASEERQANSSSAASSHTQNNHQTGVDRSASDANASCEAFRIKKEKIDSSSRSKSDKSASSKSSRKDKHHKEKADRGCDRRVESEKDSLETTNKRTHDNSECGSSDAAHAKTRKVEEKVDNCSKSPDNEHQSHKSSKRHKHDKEHKSTQKHKSSDRDKDSHSKHKKKKKSYDEKDSSKSFEDILTGGTSKYPNLKKKKKPQTETLDEKIAKEVAEVS